MMFLKAGAIIIIASPLLPCSKKRELGFMNRERNLVAAPSLLFYFLQVTQNGMCVCRAKSPFRELEGRASERRGKIKKSRELLLPLFGTGMECRDAKLGTCGMHFCYRVQTHP